MSFRAFTGFALSCLTLAGCGGGSGLLGAAGSGDAAEARFVNASASTLDLASSGVVVPANAAIAPGGGTECFSVPDPQIASLSVRQAGTTVDLPGFVTTFANGGRYTLVAFPGVTGTVQFLSVPNTSLPAAGRSELRVVNASTALGTVDVHVTTLGAAIGTPNVSSIPFGTASGTFDVAAGTMQIRLTSTGSTNVVFDAGSRLLESGRSYTLIVSSATAALLVADCF
jgi:hypothetical protein